MLEIKGKYTTAKIMIDDVEETALAQVYNLCSHPAFTEPIVMQVDIHTGASAPIGFTMPLTERIVPNVVSVDIGCGVLVVGVGENFTTNKDKLLKMDEKIRNVIPMGNNIQDKSSVPSKYFEKNFPWDEANDLANKFVVSYNKKFNTNFNSVKFTYDWFLKKQKEIGMRQDAEMGICSLGGGNHFVSIEKSVNYDSTWLLIHCGSRNFGKMICEYHMKVAKNNLDHKRNVVLQNKINEIKLNYSGSMIPIKMKEAKQSLGIDFGTNTNGMEFLEGQLAMDYFMDMIFSQKYAQFNRSSISDKILKVIGVKEIDRIESIHNYIDFSDMIIRKGAIRSYSGERIIVPISMAYGSYICEGKSNPDFNYSCSHGAGRLMSRGNASRSIDMKDFEYQMKDVVSTSVVKSCLDESPGAYKNPKTIEIGIEPTAKIIDHITPLLNIKDKGNQMSWKERRELEKAGKQVNVNVHRSDKEKDIRKSKKELRKIKNGEYFESMGEPYEDLD